MKVEYIGENKFFLHQEVGKGTMPDGKECRLIMINPGLIFEVYDKDGKNWKSYSATWMEISKAIVDEILKLENAEKK